MAPVLFLSLRQLGGRWRILLILFLAALPIALTAVVAATLGDEESFDENFTDTLMDGLLIAGIMPIVIMVLATASFGNELGDRTLSFLVLRPIPRTHIVLPKLLASIVLGGPLLIISGVVSTLLGLEASWQAGLAAGAAMLAGVVAYGAIFTWAGLLTTRALAFALLYVFLGEGLISTFLGGARYLSVRGYSLAILHGIDERNFESLEGRVIEFPAAIAGAVAVSVLFVFLTVRQLRRMDVP